ncbi:DUF4810 domain-containing protein [Azonexus sp.]|uniref:DUF4810 domain-containing protein n=1 Tax=Azonexus sp. TaxID=1872668 RepID=UPI0035B16386
MRSAAIRATRLAGAALCALALTGCATRPEPLYYWGNYQGQVYAYFKGDTAPEEQILALEAELEKARAKGKRPPPGYHAHLAMLYGKTGRTDRLQQHLEAEKAQFPESAPFMDFLLKKIAP